MAKAGFAGSLIVQAGWRGKAMSKGMKKSSTELKSFSRGVKGLLALATGGLAAVGGYLSVKGILGLVKMSGQGAAAWNKWQEAVVKVKQQLGRLLAGPASAVLLWASDFLGKAAAWLSQFDSLKQLLWEGIVPALSKAYEWVSRLLNEVVGKLIERLQYMMSLINVAKTAGSAGIGAFVGQLATSTSFVGD